MASRLKVNEITKTSGSGTVEFPHGGADFAGDVSATGDLTLDSLGGAITMKSYAAASRPANPSVGTIIWNTDAIRAEVWTGDLWNRMDVPGGVFPKNGLIVHLDATDTNSYNGSGTVWTDLSGSGNNFNIVASAHTGATGSKKAYMNFQGSHGMAKNGGDISLSGDVTYACVTRIRNSTSTWRTLTRSYSADHHVIVQSGAWNIGMYDNNGTGFRDSGADQTDLSGYLSNTFMIMIWRWHATNDDPTYEFIVNGETLGTRRDSNARYNRGFGSIGGYHGGSGQTNPSTGSQHWGDIRMFAAWSRRITNTEICDITNHLKSRGYLQDP